MDGDRSVEGDVDFETKKAEEEDAEKEQEVEEKAKRDDGKVRKQRG